MTIDLGIFGTPMLFTMPQAVREALVAGVPCHSRPATPADYVKRVRHIVEHDVLNSEVTWLDRRFGWRRSDRSG